LSTHWFVDINRFVYHNGGQKPISLLAEPFSFGEPLEWFPETTLELPENKSALENQNTLDRAMGLWHRDSIVARLNSAQDRKMERPPKE